jgi:hypothetical protein
MQIYFQERGKWSDWRRQAYQAKVSVYENNGELRGEFRGSTWPNPFDPHYEEKKLCDAYGCIDEGKYWWEYGGQAHNRLPGLNIAKNGPIVTIAPNPNQENRRFADHIDVHSGQSHGWRGSAGCLTIHPDDWIPFLNVVRNREGVLHLQREQNEVA